PDAAGLRVRRGHRRRVARVGAGATRRSLPAVGRHSRLLHDQQPLQRRDAGRDRSDRVGSDQSLRGPLTLHGRTREPTAAMTLTQRNTTDAGAWLRDLRERSFAWVVEQQGVDRMPATLGYADLCFAFGFSRLGLRAEAEEATHQAMAWLNANDAVQ